MQEELKEFYRNQYKEISYSGLGLKFSNFFHRKLEEKYSDEFLFDKVLEVGAGDCQHIAFVKHKFKSYIQTDILDFRNQLSAIKNVKFEVQDAQKLRYMNEEFDRLVSTCLLHHLENPDIALKEWRRILKHDGRLDILLPSDPGIMYRLARRLASERKVKRKIDSNIFNLSKYRFIHAIDHRNHVDSLEKMIYHVFIDDRIEVKRFPPFIPFWNFNLFSIFHITLNKNKEK